jgi:N-acetylglucosamine-6-phosphate deacetylase
VTVKVEFPGFCDLQVNGFAGVDFNRPGCPPQELDAACRALRATGVTRFLPTLITSSLERFAACVRPLARSSDPAVAGIHMEGPYLSRTEARGAHPAEHLRDAAPDDFDRRQEAAEGRIVLVTLAPEVPGALALIEHLAARGVRVAIGHSDASPAQVRDAVAAGATLSTHLGNGCRSSLPRHPNLVWEQLAADALSASLIADGHHLPPATLKTMVRAKSPSRTILVTDATAAAGAPPGRYTLGDLEIEGDATGRVTIPGTQRLAGSALTLDRAVSIAAVATGLPLEEVLPMASTRPAAVLGISPSGRVRADWDPVCGALTSLRVEPT